LIGRADRCPPTAEPSTAPDPVLQVYGRFSGSGDKLDSPAAGSSALFVPTSASSMSLINDALKKAQRSRSADSGDLAPTPGGNTRITKRGVPLSAKSLLLAASGVLVLFVLAVVVTVYFLNRPAATTTTAVAKATPTVAPTTDTNSPVIVAPVIAPPPQKAAPPEPPPSVPPTQAQAPKADPAPATPPGKSPTPEPATAPATKTAATAPAQPAPAPPAPTALPDERVHAFLDGLHVAAVSIRGNESRVMIGERVFRLNDIVERSLGLRLTKVDANQLTFTDGNGVAYTKYF
jgi:hypothetical protein